MCCNGLEGIGDLGMRVKRQNPPQSERGNSHRCELDYV